MARLKTYNKRAKKVEDKKFLRWLREQVEEHNNQNPDKKLVVISINTFDKLGASRL